jgi:hypothetical protein
LQRLATIGCCPNIEQETDGVAAILDRVADGCAISRATP